MTRICGNKANVSEPAKDNFVDGKKMASLSYTLSALLCRFAKR